MVAAGVGRSGIASGVELVGGEAKVLDLFLAESQ